MQWMSFINRKIELLLMNKEPLSDTFLNSVFKFLSSFEIKTGPFLRDSSVTNFHTMFLKFSLTVLRVAQNSSFLAIWKQTVLFYI